MNTIFNEEYFKSDNYINYLSKKERYIKTADELYHVLNKFNIVTPDTTILDYGCSVGFLIQGLEKVGCNFVYGYDISEWATNEARQAGCNILESPAGYSDFFLWQ